MLHEPTTSLNECAAQIVLSYYQHTTRKWHKRLRKAYLNRGGPISMTESQYKLSNISQKIAQGELSVRYRPPRLARLINA